jgi:TPR repeat protein
MKCQTAALLLFSCFGYLLGLGQQPAPIWNAAGKYGVVNNKGQVVVPFEYDFISEFSQGLAKVEKNKKFGLVDISGKLIIPVMYESIYHCDNSGWPKPVKINGKAGAINRQNKLVIPATYRFIDCFYNGLAIVADAKEETYGMMDSTGKMVIPFGIYQDLSAEFNNGLARAKKNEQWGYINKAGTAIIPFIYEDAFPFFNGSAEVTKDYEQFYINTKGQEVNHFMTELRKKYEQLNYPLHGQIRYRKERIGWCVMDTTGKELIPAGKYDDVDYFLEGIAFVKKKNKWGGIDQKGNLVIPFYYMGKIRPFKDGLALLRNIEGEQVLINKKGEAVYGKQIVLDATKAATDYATGERLYQARKYPEAAPLLRSAADNGHEEAMYLLGLLYWKGFGVPQDVDESMKWLKRASNNGSYYAQEELKKIEKTGLPQVDEYKNGYDAFQLKKYKEAVSWFNKAAAKGNMEAMFNLGMIYQLGAGTEIPANEKEAVGWYQKAADKGHVNSMNNLGQLYLSEEGIQDFKLALQWFTKGADKGHSGCMYNVGVMYANGLGVNPQMEEAYKWFKKAADKGLDEAKEAVKRIEKEGILSAEVKNGDAALNKMEYEAAMGWYQKGVDKGYTEAMYKMGLLYQKRHKSTEAKEWFKKAAALGHFKAKEALDDLDLIGF